MTQTTEKVPQQVPDWGVRVLQAAIRAYRYTGEYIRGTDELQVTLAVRRAADYAGTITFSHYLSGGNHYLRLNFQPPEKESKPTLFVARSLEQLKQYAVRTMEAVCEAGNRRQSGWCNDCSQAERHKAAEFGPPPEDPLAR